MDEWKPETIRLTKNNITAQVGEIAHGRSNAWWNVVGGPVRLAGEADSVDQGKERCARAVELMADLEAIAAYTVEFKKPPELDVDMMGDAGCLVCGRDPMAGSCLHSPEEIRLALKVLRQVAGSKVPV